MNREAAPADLMPVTVGFVPLVDAALLVAAREEGFARAEGIDLTLVREGSWAAVRDKLNVGLFDGAHMLAPAAIASVLGIGHLKVPLIAPVALNLDGNAVTVSRPLATILQGAFSRPGVDDVTPAMTASALAVEAARRRQAGEDPLTVGVVFGFSSHLLQVAAWLRLGGVDPEREVRFVVIPPPLMVESLAAGLIDLFCAGAPWNRMAEIAGAGHVLHACARFMPDCPEKLFVMRQDREGAAWTQGFVRAIARAAEWTSDPANRPALAAHLARADYVGAPADVIESILAGTAPTLFPTPVASWIRLDGDAIRPSATGLGDLFDRMCREGQAKGDAASRREAGRLARADLFDSALAGSPG